MDALLVVFATAGAVLGLLSLLLLRYGVWPRRRGDQPHCRGCGNLLIANESGRCPECGRELSRWNVVRGERVRRTGLTIVAWMTCPLAGACFWCAASPKVRAIDWYSHRPARWVVTDAVAADPARAKRAWAELAHRRGEGRLPESAERKLLKIALAEQAKPQSGQGPLHEEMIDYLADQWVGGKLAAPDAERFFAQCTVMKLRARPVVLGGHPLPYEACFATASLRGTWAYRQVEEGVWLDGKQIEKGGKSDDGDGFGNSSFGGDVPAPGLGTHTIRVKVRDEIFHGPRSSMKTSRPSSTREVLLEQQVQVLEPTTDDVKLLDRPELYDEVRSRIHVTRARQAVSGAHERHFPFYLIVTVEAPPVNLAFDVLARYGEKDYGVVGSIAVEKGGDRNVWFRADELIDTAAGHVDVMLRSSPDAARQTIDLTEIWKGEIVLLGITVQTTEVE